MPSKALKIHKAIDSSFHSERPTLGAAPFVILNEVKDLVSFRFCSPKACGACFVRMTPCGVYRHAHAVTLQSRIASRSNFI